MINLPPPRFRSIVFSRERWLWCRRITETPPPGPGRTTTWLEKTHISCIITNSNKTQTHFLNSESTIARAVSPSHEGDYGVKDKSVDVVAPTGVIALIVYARGGGAYGAVASLTARLNTLTYFSSGTSMHLRRAFKMHPAPSSLAGTGGTCWYCACDMLAMARRK